MNTSDNDISRGQGAAPLGAPFLDPSEDALTVRGCTRGAHGLQHMKALRRQENGAR